MNEAVIYCRVSTQEQTKNLSLATQQKACEAYCAQHGFEVGKVFVEEGESAKTADRTELQKLLTHCRENKGRVQFVVVYHTSRFARNSHDHLALRVLLSKYGSSLRSVTEKLDESSQGKFIETMYAAMNQLDNDVKADRTTVGMKAALDKGRWPFTAPLGYLNTSGKHGEPTLKHDPERADLMRMAFELYATGLHTKRGVLKTVAGLGLKTRKRKNVSAQTFDKLLCNPIYAGWVSVPSWGARKKGNFEPIVSQELFDTVQALLTGKRPSVIPHVRNHPDFPLRCFVRCGGCNKPLTGSFSTGRKAKRYPYYHCPKCKGVRARKIDFETRFTDFLGRLQPKPEYLKLFREIVLDVWKQKQEESLVQSVVSKQQFEELQDKKEKLIDAFVYRKEIDRATYDGQLDKRNEQIALAEMATHDARLEELDIEAVLNFSEYVILNAPRLWTEFDLNQKQRLQTVLFPEGVTFSDSGFGTAVTSVIFNLLQQPEGEKTRMATPAGFEPASTP